MLMPTARSSFIQKVSYLSLLGLIACLHAAPSWAGARGYNVVLVDISTPELQNAKTLLLPVREAKRLDGRDPCFACGVDDHGIAVLYVRKVPAPFSPERVRQVVDGDRAATAQIKRELRKYHDDLIRHGFDGLYVYERTPTKVTVYGLGPDAGGKLRVVSEPAGDVTPQQLDRLLERASKAFEAAFVP